jgi:hypothetical protein
LDLLALALTLDIDADPPKRGQKRELTPMLQKELREFQKMTIFAALNL